MALPAKPYLRELRLEREPDSSDDSSDDAYPFNIPAVRCVDGLTFHADVTFLTGENGSGKSTLLEAMALGLGFGAEGGTRNVRFETAATVSPLHEVLRLVKGHRAPRDHYFLRAETFYNVATYMDAGTPLPSYGGLPLHERSHGESFMTLLTHKFAGHGLYLLDEPEAALSATRQLAALVAIDRLVAAESQFIIATHSPILLAYPRARILLLDGAGIRELAYEETDPYVITRDFLNNYAGRLARLLAADDDD